MAPLKRSISAGGALAMYFLISSCTSSGQTENMNYVGKPVASDSYAQARRNPLSAAAHYATAMQLMNQKSVTRGDLEMALSGFRTASRLAPDLWEPMAGAALVSYQLGNTSDALDAMGYAIERRGSAGPLALPFALLAYRAQAPELARAAFAQATPTLDTAGTTFLATAFAGTGWRPTHPATPPVAPTDQAAQPSVLIEAYMIRDTRQSLSGQGLNLLDSLSVQFGGTLLNYSYDSSVADAGIRTGNAAISVPAITYSLNLAARDQSQITLEASPIVMASEGKTSSFLEGGSVMIVPLGDSSSPVEKDVGTSIQVTPQRIGADDVDLDVVLEMSNISGQSVVDAGRGANLINTDKTHVEVSATVPFGKAILVGSADSLARRRDETRSLSESGLPGLSRRDNVANSRNVLVLLSVHALEGQHNQSRSANDWARTLFGTSLPTAAEYGKRPAETPAPDLTNILPDHLD